MNIKSVISVFLVLFCFSFFSYAGVGTQGHFMASLTILPVGTSCGVLNEGVACSNDAKMWEESLKEKNKGFILSKENCQAYRDGDFIIVSY